MIDRKLDIRTVDMHLGGEPARIVVGGMPPVYGKTMREKQEYIRSHLDEIRTSLMLEPRGHRDMFGAILLEPCNPEADYGAVYMFGSNYEDLCGHATICIATMLTDRKMVPVTEPETRIRLDTPAGLVSVDVRVKNGKAESASLNVVPGFVYRRNVILPTGHFGDIRADVVYAGNVFLMIEAGPFGEIIPSHASRFAEIGMEAVASARRNFRFIHPVLGELRIATVNFYHEDRDVIIFGEGQVDRSPCGTGTSARVVLLQDQGKMKEGESFRNHGILGTALTGTAGGSVKVGEYDAFCTKITGLGTVTADCEFHIDPADPLFRGFLLS